MDCAREIVADAERQSAGRWIAFTRRLNGEVVWRSDRIHPTKRWALIEAIAKAKGEKGE